eukprot:3737433-Rhodomonas_salina.2
MPGTDVAHYDRASTTTSTTSMFQSFCPGSSRPNSSSTVKLGGIQPERRKGVVCASASEELEGVPSPHAYYAQQIYFRSSTARSFLPF